VFGDKIISQLSLKEIHRKLKKTLSSIHKEIRISPWWWSVPFSVFLEMRIDKKALSEIVWEQLIYMMLFS